MKKNIFVIIGSASERSANQKLIDEFSRLTADQFNIMVFNDLKTLPHFDPVLSSDHPPALVMEFRNRIATADGVLICTPEYVFSIPSGLKNAIEWCVSTTVFSGKPIGLITASADGQMGHKELQLIMKTLGAEFSEETTLLVQGIKGKINAQGEVTDPATTEALARFVVGFTKLLNNRQ